MDRYTFYSKRSNYLSHSDEYGKKHYQKIENYYGPGKTRYFWSKEEWDAYQRKKEEMYQDAKADVANAAVTKPAFTITVSFAVIAAPALT